MTLQALWRTVTMTLKKINAFCFLIQRVHHLFQHVLYFKMKVNAITGTIFILIQIKAGYIVIGMQRIRNV